MKKATIKTLEKIALTALSVAKWVLVRRKIIVLLLPVVGLGAASVTGNVSIVAEIVAQLMDVQ